MMEVYGGIIFWNDGELLERCLKSALAAGIKPIAIDGAYKNFPRNDGEKFWSTDGSLQVAEKLAWKTVSSPAEGWESQVEKRNKYLELVPVGSYVFVIDADEEIIPPFFPWHLLNQDVYRVHENRWEYSHQMTPMSGVRIYRVYTDLVYQYQHCRLYRLGQHNPKDLESGLVMKAHGLGAMKPLLPITLNHYKYARPVARVKQKNEFYEKRGEALLGY